MHHFDFMIQGQVSGMCAGWLPYIGLPYMAEPRVEVRAVVQEGVNEIVWNNVAEQLYDEVAFDSYKEGVFKFL